MKALKTIYCLALMLVFLSTQTALSAVVAGKISAAKGTVIATGADGKTRKLRKGKKFYEGDKIDTAKRGAVAMKFKDGTKFALGGESTMQIDEFVFGVSPDVGGYLDPQLFGEQMRQLQFSGVSPFLS